MFDWFVASLRCPVCGTVSPPTSATNMQTHLRDNADGSELAVGSELEALDVRTPDILNSGYQLVEQPRPGEPSRLLESWRCPTCGHDNWAVVTIDGTRITGIEAVTLDRATLQRAHFISEQCDILAAQLSGIPAAELSAGVVNSVDVLRERLPSCRSHLRPADDAPVARVTRDTAADRARRTLDRRSCVSFREVADGIWAPGAWRCGKSQRRRTMLHSIPGPVAGGRELPLS